MAVAPWVALFVIVSSINGDRSDIVLSLGWKALFGVAHIVVFVRVVRIIDSSLVHWVAAPLSVD